MKLAFLVIGDQFRAIVAMVIYKVKKTAITSSPIIRHLVDIDAVIVASTDKER